MKRVTLASLLVFACTLTAYSKEPELVRDISWSELKKADQLITGEVQAGKTPDAPQQLTVQDPGGERKLVELFVLRDPGVTRSRYALVGEVRYEDMQGTGYLEMWNHFPDGSHYFTRTLASRGMLQSLRGTSDWRPFSLPFFIGEKPHRPTRLVVNLVFDGGGTVHLRPLKLVQSDTADLTAAPGAWWGDRTGGLLGGIAGAVFGCLGAIIGVLAGTGRARNFVLALDAAMIACGAIALAVGSVAFFLSQPYAVWYPLVLLGILLVAIPGGLRSMLRRRYEQHELRKIAAMDVGPAGQPT